MALSAYSSARKIFAATSFPRSPTSPTGPTQEGQPASQGQAAINCAVCCKSRGARRYSGALWPTLRGITGAGRKVVVAITDGVDEGSRLPISEAPVPQARC